MQNNCLEGSTLLCVYYVFLIFKVLPSRQLACYFSPGTVSRVTTASLSTATIRTLSKSAVLINFIVQAGRHLFCLNVYFLFIALKMMEPLPPFGQRPLVLKEGGVSLPLWALRACSYKTKAEDWHQGAAPSSSRGLSWFLLNLQPQCSHFLISVAAEIILQTILGR